MPVDLPNIPDLVACLRRLIEQIPLGRVTTYGDLADALGDRIAARWVGHHAVHHEHDATCACHRIVRADGSLGNYITGITEEKSQRLATEGVTVSDGRVDLAAHRFAQFASDRPLAGLRQLQESLTDQISLKLPKRTLKFIAGVDVSYAPDGDGVAAYVLVEADSAEVVDRLVVCRPARFPYITSYLSFRELPLLLALLDEVDRHSRAADVVLVDGSGRLHPRQAGIACHLGVLCDRPTIGVTKKLLCGSVDVDGMRPMQSRPVLIDDETVGVALRSTSGSRRPIFISPGHRMDTAGAEQIARGMLRGRRLPDPLYWADRLSREAARLS